VRQVASLDELQSAWCLVAEILHQDDSHPRNYAFYARHFPHHPELLLIALAAGQAASTAPEDAATAAKDAASPAASQATSLSTSSTLTPSGEVVCGALLAHAEPDYVWIGKLAVAAGHRQHGAGSALLTLIEQNALAAGHHQLMLGAAPDAEAFYSRRGYR